jgi:hypothetical protein
MFGFQQTADDHFIDYPFSQDGTALPDDLPKPENILKALQAHVQTLKSSNDDAEKAQALRFIIHFVGDIHQPLHTRAASSTSGRAKKQILISYYLPGTTGWAKYFQITLPTALWLPQVQPGDASFGVRTNQFGFSITWASGMSVVVEASTSLANPVWSPVSTNTLIGGSSYFSDAQWTNYPNRFYRIRSP